MIFSRVARALAPLAIGAALAVAMTWPLALNLGSDIPQDLVDPLLIAWHQAWIGHAAVHQPLHLFQANWYWPERDSLAFTDAMPGYLPLYLVSAQGIHAAVAMYDLLFLFAYALAFAGIYLLARELGVSPLGAFVGGVAFAYAPYRLAQDGHLHVISSGAIPLALFLLVRGYRRGSGRLVLAGWLVTAWQVTLGFTLGVPLVYLVLTVGAITGFTALRRRKLRLARPVVVATAAGLCLVAATAFLQSRPYYRVAHDHPESKRTPELVAFYSPPVRSFLAASQDSFLWDGPTKHAWDSLTVPGEQALFPGITILLLAALGLIGSAYPRSLRVWLAIGTVTCALLSLGLREEGHFAHAFMPYRLLYELAPGWDAFRTPGRVHTLTSLGLALLAAAGVETILRTIRTKPILRRSNERVGRREAAAYVTTALLTSFVLLEGLGPTQHPQVPAVPAGQVDLPDPQLHLPSNIELDNLYAYWSIAGFPRIANGGGSFTPTRLAHIREVSTRFPDATSVSYLRGLGFRTVVLHPELAVGTPWERAALRPITGLHLVREQRDGVVVFRLQP